MRFAQKTPDGEHYQRPPILGAIFDQSVADDKLLAFDQVLGRGTYHKDGSQFVVQKAASVR